MMDGSSRPAIPGAVDLATLIDRETPISWFEAVAVVQELCAVLPETRQAGQRAALEFEDIALTPEGGVEVRGVTTRGVPTVPQVAHVLLALLGEAQTPPVQLRLLALQEVSATAGRTTLADFSSQLAPFERPGRRNTIRELWERCTRAPAREVDARPKEPARTARVLPTRLPWWRNRRIYTSAATVALLVAIGMAAVWIRRWAAPLLSGGGQRPATEAAAADGDAMSAEHAERIRAAARRVWLGSEDRPAVPAPPPPLGAEPVAVVIAAPGAASQGLKPEAPAGESAAAAIVPAVPGASGEAAAELEFSAASADVLPPLPVWPHLPTSPKAGMRLEDLPQVELVVTPTGEVESVKLVTQPARVTSAMMLSAIKAWRFAPATRDGRPVRYRLALRLTNQ